MAPAFIGKIRNTLNVIPANDNIAVAIVSGNTNLAVFAVLLVLLLPVCALLPTVWAAAFLLLSLFLLGVPLPACASPSAPAAAFSEIGGKLITSTTRRLIGNRGHHCRTDILDVCLIMRAEQDP